MNSTQLQNLKNLRDLGRRIVAEPERYPLKFGGWDCGTHACWSGWWGRVNKVNGSYAYDRAEALFGISPVDRLKLFAMGAFVGHPEADFPGLAAYAELKCRLAYLDTLIAEHEPQAPKPRGLPESITRIFDRELVIDTADRQGAAP